MKPRVLVLRAAGINCDEETAFAFERFGAVSTKVHINELLAGRTSLSEFDLLAIPGGFSYGDNISGGKVLAIELLHHLKDDLLGLVERGGLVLGICNGFQVLVKTGLLPGLAEPIGKQEVTLTDNDSNRYEDRWVHVEAVSAGSAFLRQGERLALPLAHAEGRYIPGDERIHAELVRTGRVALRYVTPDGGQRPGFPGNPNGSFDDVAGLLDRTGRVLGLMPHPERALFRVHHPDWTTGAIDMDSLGGGEGDGAILFRNAVEHLKG
ncbi:MAG: phosphoribosylformylglycinamidine synthase I [Planctomycetota bacterium]